MLLDTVLGCTEDYEAQTQTRKQTLKHRKCPKYKKLQHDNMWGVCVCVRGDFEQNEFEIEWGEN